MESNKIRSDQVLSDLPFIGCFRTNNNYYIYDTNSNEIIQVSKKDYKYLSDIFNNEYPTSHLHKPLTIQAMIKNGYLSSNRPKGVIPGINISEYSYLVNNNLSQCVLELTQDCNLDCVYCCYSHDNKGHRNYSNKRMTWKTAKKSIDYLLNHNSKSEELVLSFYGGEPFLEFELLKDCVNYIKDVTNDNNKLFLNCTTNGTLINDNIANYLFDNNVRVHISIDGPSDLHNKNRIKRKSQSGSFNNVMDGLCILKKYYKEYYRKYITLHCVYGPWTDLEKIAEFFCIEAPVPIRDLSIRLSYIGEPYGSDRFKANKYSIVNESYKKLNRMWFEYLKNDNKDKYKYKKILKSLFELPFLSFYHRSKEILQDYLPTMGMCNPGIRKYYVDVKGNIIPCERVSEKYVIGNVHNSGINIETGYKILNRIAAIFNGRCNNCIFCRICSSCLSNYTDINGNISKEAVISNCQRSFYECKVLILNWVKSIENNPACFDYMENIKLR